MSSTALSSKDATPNVSPKNKSIDDFEKNVRYATVVRLFGHTHNLIGPTVDVEENLILNSFSQKSVAFGSCFAGYIHRGLIELGLDCFFEPTTCRHFTSRSFLTMFRRHESGNLRLNDREFVEKDGYYISRLHYSYKVPVDEVSREEALDILEDKERRLLNNIIDADILILTLGTATYLRNNVTGEFINNAAGLEKDEYDICRISVKETTEDLKEIFDILKRIKKNPFKVIITVSPQRYGWLEIRATTPTEHRKGRGGTLVHGENRSGTGKDGLVYNNGDKARVRAGLDEFLLTARPDLDIEYFPSYDIIMDELRMHESFVTHDFLHVSQLSVSYVLDRFLKTHCTPELLAAIAFRRAWQKVPGQGAEQARNLIKSFEKNPEEQLEFAARIFSDLSRHRSATNCVELSKRILGAFSANPDPRMKMLCEKFETGGFDSASEDSVARAEPVKPVRETLTLAIKNKEAEIHRLNNELAKAQYELKNRTIFGNIKNLFTRKAQKVSA